MLERDARTLGRLDGGVQSTNTNSFRFSRTWQKSTMAAAWAGVGPSGMGIGKVSFSPRPLR